MLSAKHIQQFGIVDPLFLSWENGENRIGPIRVDIFRGSVISLEDFKTHSQRCNQHHCHKNPANFFFKRKSFSLNIFQISKEIFNDLI